MKAPRSPGEDSGKASRSSREDFVKASMHPKAYYLEAPRSPRVAVEKALLLRRKHRMVALMLPEEEKLCWRLSQPDHRSVARGNYQGQLHSHAHT